MQGLERAIGGEPAPKLKRSMPGLQLFGRDEDDEEDDTMTLARALPMTAHPQRLIPAPKRTLARLSGSHGTT